MGFIKKIFGTKDIETQPIAHGGPFATKAEALAAAQTEIDKIIQVRQERK